MAAVGMGSGGRWFRITLSLLVLAVAGCIAATAWEPIAAMHPAYWIALGVVGITAAVGLVTGVQRRPDGTGRG